MTARRFTADEDAKIIAWRASGDPVSLIAQRLGRNLDSVKHRADLIGAVAPSREVTPEDVAKILDLWQAGLSLKRIAQHMRRGTKTVCQIIADAQTQDAERRRQQAAKAGAREWRYEDDPVEAARPFRPVRVAIKDPLGGLRKAS